MTLLRWGGCSFVTLHGPPTGHRRAVTQPPEATGRAQPPTGHRRAVTQPPEATGSSCIQSLSRVVDQTSDFQIFLQASCFDNTHPFNLIYIFLFYLSSLSLSKKNSIQYERKIIGATPTDAHGGASPRIPPVFQMYSTPAGSATEYQRTPLSEVIGQCVVNLFELLLVHLPIDVSRGLHALLMTDEPRTHAALIRLLF